MFLLVKLIKIYIFISSLKYKPHTVVMNLNGDFDVSYMYKNVVVIC